MPPVIRDTRPDLWSRDGGIYLGAASDRFSGKPPSLAAANALRYEDDRHIVTIGPSGSGKSRRLLLTNLGRLLNWSILVIDPKGELAAHSAVFRERRVTDSNMVLLNPFNERGLESHGFNPLSVLNPASDDFPDDALGLAEALIRVHGQDPHWTESAQDLVAALIMYVCLIKPQTGSLIDVRGLLGQPANVLREMILAEEEIEFGGERVPGIVSAARQFACPELQTKAIRFADINAENRELHGIISAALTQTRWLDSRPMQQDLRRSTFDFSVMKQQPTTVYLILPARRLGTHSTWLRVVIASMLQSVMRDTRESAVPVLLMLDEFAQLGHLPIIEDTMAMMRAYGVKLWAIFQDLAQAKDIYGERWESFIGNAGVLQSFGPQDWFTGDYLSHLSGTSMKPVRSVARTTNKDADGRTSTSTSETITDQAMPTLLPQDLRRFGKGYSIVWSHKFVRDTFAHTYLPDPTAFAELREMFE